MLTPSHLVHLWAETSHWESHGPGEPKVGQLYLVTLEVDQKVLVEIRHKGGKLYEKE